MASIMLDNMQRTLPFSDPMRQAILSAIRSVLDLAGAPEDIEIFVSVIGSRRMQQLNRRERGINRETDVLSFPCIDWEGKEPGSFLAVEELDHNPDTGNILLGDIIISLPKAAQQAEEYGHSLMRELGFLAAHGTLHLLGYDHMTPKDQQQMFALQEKALEHANLKRE